MIKILQINSYSGIGGGEMVMFNIIESLNNSFDFVIVAPKGEFLGKYREMNLKIYQICRQSNFSNILKIRKIVKREKPKIIHCHGTRAAFWSRLAVLGLKNRPRTVYTLHGFHLIRKSGYIKWLFVLIEKLLNYWTDVLVCVSEADKKAVLKYKTISPKKVVVVKNGIDIEKFQVNPDLVKRTREDLNLQNKFVLISIGRLHPPKDLPTLLEAIKIIRENYSEIWKNLILLIVGDGPLRELLEDKVRNLGIFSYIYFLGFREDVPLLINLSDLVILSTKWEGLPLVPIEAGAGRKPVIASDVDGVRETIIDRKTGYLFKSAQDLAEKILAIYENEDLRKEMGENGYQFVLKNFNREKMVEEYKKLYQFAK